MPTVTIIDQRGQAHPLDTIDGASVMEVARQAGLAGIDAVCGGACACGTCMVDVLADWAGFAGEPSVTEAEILSLIGGATDQSRLSCQLRMAPSLDGLCVRIPQQGE